MYIYKYICIYIYIYIYIYMFICIYTRRTDGGQSHHLCSITQIPAEGQDLRAEAQHIGAEAQDL